jgi:hypothetical protein
MVFNRRGTDVLVLEPKDSFDFGDAVITISVAPEMYVVYNWVFYTFYVFIFIAWCAGPEIRDYMCNSKPKRPQVRYFWTIP